MNRSGAEQRALLWSAREADKYLLAFDKTEWLSESENSPCIKFKGSRKRFRREKGYLRLVRFLFVSEAEEGHLGSNRIKPCKGFF